MTAEALDILAHLVAADTRNPPRALTGKSDVFARIAAHLPGFDVEITDEGGGSVSLLAVRGAPEVVFNYHLDTVPVAEGWTRDPFELSVTDGRATGLGACDIKGALAAMLAASARAKGNLAILVTSDEEAGNSCCVRRFLERPQRFKRVIVAEPTLCRAVSAHRGIISGRITFGGVAGHASEARAIDDSANHRLIAWGAALVQAIRTARPGEPLSDLRLNIGRIDGGVKPNMIAASATAAFNLRTPPGSDNPAILNAVAALAPEAEVLSLETPFVAPSLPAGGDAGASDKSAWIERLGVETSAPVDFWTEASLFDAAGLPAIVIGSGDIAQAHTADEWVEVAQLDKLQNIYMRWIGDGRA